MNWLQLSSISAERFLTVNMSKGKGQKTELVKWTIFLLFIFSIAERKDVGKSKSLSKTSNTVEERLSNTGLLLSFLNSKGL